MMSCRDHRLTPTCLSVFGSGVIILMFGCPVFLSLRFHKVSFVWPMFVSVLVFAIYILDCGPNGGMGSTWGFPISTKNS